MKVLNLTLELDEVKVQAVSWWWYIHSASCMVALLCLAER